MQKVHMLIISLIYWIFPYGTDYMIIFKCVYIIEGCLYDLLNLLEKDLRS